MREHRFKGKRIDNGEWVEGYYLVAAGMPFISAFAERTPIPVIPDTICEYTGLHDKNGKEIWENDIIASDCFKYVVKFGEYNSMWCSCECECNQHIGFYLTEGLSGNYLETEILHERKIEVIGNIFDNSELLKESK